MNMKKIRKSVTQYRLNYNYKYNAASPGLHFFQILELCNIHKAVTQNRPLQKTPFCSISLGSYHEKTSQGLEQLVVFTITCLNNICMYVKRFSKFLSIYSVEISLIQQELGNHSHDIFSHVYLHFTYSPSDAKNVRITAHILRK